MRSGEKNKVQQEVEGTHSKVKQSWVVKSEEEKIFQGKGMY